MHAEIRDTCQIGDVSLGNGGRVHCLVDDDGNVIRATWCANAHVRVWARVERGTLIAPCSESAALAWVSDTGDTFSVTATAYPNGAHGLPLPVALARHVPRATAERIAKNARAKRTLTNVQIVRETK